MKYKIIKKIKDYFYHRKLVRSANRHITGMKNIDFRNNFVELNGVVAEARTKWKKTLDEVQTECKMKNETTEQKEIEERYNNYLKYCRENKMPSFAPQSCYSCGKSVFKGTSEKFPTGCPYCHRSFVS